MSYFTSKQILTQAGPMHRSHYSEAPANDRAVPAQLNYQAAYSSTSRPSQDTIASHYAGHSSHPHSAHLGGSPDMYHHYSSATVQRQQSMPMMSTSERSYAATSSPIPVSSYQHNPYVTTAPPMSVPFSERRNSQDTRVPYSGSSSGSSYVFPDYLNLPPEYRNLTEAQNAIKDPDYLNLPPEYQSDFKETQNQAHYPDYLNLPPEYRAKQMQNSQHGPIRSPTRTTHAQSPYSPSAPSSSPSSTRSRTASSSATRRKPHRYPADPFPIVKDGKGPTNHMRIPQQVFYDNTYVNTGMASSKPITFKMKNFTELGVRLSDCLDKDRIRLPEIEDKNDIVFGEDEPYREIKLKITWPGYYCHPFTRRVNIRKGEMTRMSMLFNVVTAIDAFIRKVKSDPDIVCERGVELWKLTGRDRITADHLILTGIVHRGGPNWQPEIWCPLVI